MRKIASVLFVTLALAAVAHAKPASEAGFAAARANGETAREGLERCWRYLRAWLSVTDPVTGLVPRNLSKNRFWNGKDSAADNYPFLILSAYFTDRPAFDGPIKRVLASESQLTRRRGWRSLTDDYELAPKRGLRFDEPDSDRIFFNSAEYVKDGLLTVTEWLGPSAWSRRMFELLDDSFVLADEKTPFGKVPLAGRDRDDGVEVSGDYLQALSRLYWMSGRREKYLEWATRLGDLYLLPKGKHHPTRDFDELGLRDHGSEIITGLSELYATLHFAGKLPGGAKWAKKQEEYRPHLHEMLDRVLAIGRNEDGLLYNTIDPKEGEVVDRELSDGWGYVFDAFYTVHLVDGVEAYRDAALKPLAVLRERYRGYDWEPARKSKRGGQDGYADAIEGALNLANRLPPDDPRARAAFDWIDSEIRELWSRQAEDGFIERWHVDGNFARTTLMYCLWKSQGVSIQPWRRDVRVGAEHDGKTLRVVVVADEPWSGRLAFDRPRHAEGLKLPIDWPRMNQFPEWFTVRAGERYRLLSEGASSGERTVGGKEMRTGLQIRVPAAKELRLTVTPLARARSVTKIVD